ncbi:HORMA domain-containing protein 1 [Terramyces sp. JEL0728]|nr:HORMA domain-containing protein 1 [Terramyces sp. JEL0728]
MQVLPNPQQSLCLVQNLVKATIGSIAYIRMLFPEDAFETKGIDGVAIKTLKRDFTSEKFNLCSGKQEISKTTHQLIRRLLLMTQSLESLPDDAYVTLRLFYHPSTPLSYEPPHFKKLDRVSNQEYHSTLNLGSVKTPFHDFSLKVKTNCQQQVQDYDTQELKEGLENNANLSQTQPRFFKAKEFSQSMNTDFSKKLGVTNSKTKELLDWMKLSGYINSKKKIVKENKAVIVKSSTVTKDIAVL